MQSHKKPNIIHITIDALRADHLGFGGYAKNTSPFLDSLAERGVSFRRAYSTGPGSSVSFVGIMTSTYPFDHGGYSFIDKPRVLISEALKAGGYVTYGFHSSPYLSGYFGYDRGWDVFHYLNYFKSGRTDSARIAGSRKAQISKQVSEAKNSLKQKSKILYYVAKIAERLVLVVRKAAKSLFLGYQPSHFIAEEVNRVVKESLPSKIDKPMYVWVHYLDVHAPLGLWGRVGRGLWNKIKFYWNEYAMFLFGDFPLVKYIPYFSAVNLYDDSIRYVDREAKKLVEYLESIGVIDEHSIIVINADHGEAFLDHGELMRTQKLYNENIHVPLLVLSPEKKGEVVTRPVSLVDVAPTILEFAGVAKPESYVGKNLFDTTSRPVISQASDCAGDLSNPTYAGVALIAEDYKLIHTKEKSYLFASSDTKEMQNLYDTKPARLAELESQIKPYSTPSWKEA